MALLNLSGLITDLNNVISALDLPNEDLQDLAIYLKSQLNLNQTIDAGIVNEIRTRVEGVDNTTTLEILAILSIALSLGTDDRIVTVPDINALPDLVTDPLPSGTILFVESIGTLAMVVKRRWISLDKTLVRDDTVSYTYAWGFNSSGQIGDGTTTSRSSPVIVVGGITNWKQVSAGSDHSLGVTTTGIAYGWGQSGDGQLGDDTTSNRSSPVTVVGGITNWSQVSAGGSHSLGVTTTGIAYAWGLGTSGQIGDDTTSNRSSPVTVVGGITNWKQVSAGNLDSLGVTSTGIAYGWGSNGFGNIGDGTATSRLSPVTVVGGITNWSQVSAGGDHSLGVTSTGIAYAWGLNTDGQLGDNTGTTRSSPVTVVGGITNWRQLDAGSQHRLGVIATGIAYGWGNNSTGRLGDNTTTSRSSPVTVVGGITNWSQVSAGGLTSSLNRHSLGLTSSGTAYAWGSNIVGQLGDGTTSNRSSPVTVVGSITNWSQVSAGGDHSLGVYAE